MEKKITITKKELAGLFFEATDKVATEMFKDDAFKQFRIIVLGAEINKELDKLLFEESEPEKEEPKMMKIKDISEELSDKICNSYPICSDGCPFASNKGCKYLKLNVFGEEEIDVSPYLKDGD